MTEDQLREIEARCEAATEGPWRWRLTDDDCRIPPVALDGKGYVLHAHLGVEPDGTVKAGIDFRSNNNDFQRGEESVDCNPNASFISHSRTDIPLLIAEVRRLREAIKNCGHAPGCPGREGLKCVCGKAVLNKESDDD